MPCNFLFVHSHDSQQPCFSEKVPINPIYTTCTAPNSRQSKYWSVGHKLDSKWKLMLLHVCWMCKWETANTFAITILEDNTLVMLKYVNLGLQHVVLPPCGHYLFKKSEQQLQVCDMTWTMVHAHPSPWFLPISWVSCIFLGSSLCY